MAVAIGQVFGQRVQIFTIAFERVRRCAALNAQVLQELANLRTHGGKDTGDRGQDWQDAILLSPVPCILFP